MEVSDACLKCYLCSPSPGPCHTGILIKQLGNDAMGTFEMCLASRTFWRKCPVPWAQCIILHFWETETAERQKIHNSIDFTPTCSLFLRKLFFLGLWETDKTASNMCRAGIWIRPCRSTEFNFWTCGFSSRVRICSQVHVYPVGSKVQAFLTQTCWPGARLVWFAVTVREDDLLMMFLKCSRVKWGASLFPRLVPYWHQSLFCPLPLGDMTDQKFPELLHESGRATRRRRGGGSTNHNRN